MPTPTKSARREAMAALIVKLAQAFPNHKFIGNGAAAKNGSLGSLAEIPATQLALSGGCLTEQIFCDEEGARRSSADTTRSAGFSLFPPQKRWLVEMKGTGEAHAIAQAQSAHYRLFVAKNVNYDAAGKLINPDNFRVIYNKARPDSGQGVGDLIIDDTEADTLSRDASAKPRRVWLYISIGEVEEADIRPIVFHAADRARLVGKKNSGDPTGNTNVRFWEPAWADIVIAEMTRILNRHQARQNIVGFMMDVCDSWMRPDPVWR
jgi:hypothetical protein